MKDGDSIICPLCDQVIYYSESKDPEETKGIRRHIATQHRIRFKYLPILPKKLTPSEVIERIIKLGLHHTFTPHETK